MNDSTRSIFTDVRYTSKYHQDVTSPNRPPVRRSLSESSREPRSAGFVQNISVNHIPALHKASTVSLSPSGREPSGHGFVSVKGSRTEISRNRHLDRTILAGKKRSAVESQSKGSGVESARKRRHHDRSTSQGLPSTSIAACGALPSPLFYSDSPHQRPRLPARFSSSEAAAKMLSKTQGEDKSVKTVKLARGSITSTAAPTTPSRPAPRTRHSIERNSFPRAESHSPDNLDRHDPSHILGSIGLLEILEHDPRPTFAVDLSDTKNFHSDALHIFYANPSFQSKSSPRDGHARRSRQPVELGPYFENLPAVKMWIYSRAQFGENNPRYPPALLDGDILWSCTFLRRKICIVSGVSHSNVTESNQIPVSTPPRSPLATLNYGASDQAVSLAEASPAPNDAAPTLEPEPQDYFGSVVEHIIETADDAPQSNVPVSSIESDRPSSDANIVDAKSLGKQPITAAVDIPDKFSPEHILSAACAGNVDLRYNSTGKEIGFFDWTRLPVSDVLPKHIQFARSVDWSKTSLGPIENWSADLRQMCNLIMASPHPAAMYWGEDLVAIYNEAYVLLAGQKHPALMGQSYRNAWAEIWDEVKDVFASAQTTGQATMKDDDCLFIRRNDFLEETYFSWSIIPMVGGDGSVMGLYNPAFEKTRRKIAERRMLTLREIGERTAAARDVKSFWAAVLVALECNEFDTPFVLLYSLQGESESHENSSVHSSNTTGLTNQKQCVLEGALGVPSGHPAAPPSADLYGEEGYVSYFREVQKSNKPTVVEAAGGDVPARLLEGLEVRGFNDPVQSVVVCPIHPTTGESTLGFLVLGVNPRRPFDEDYNLFIQLLGRQLTTSLASVVLFEEEIKRGQQAAKLAALDRIQLSEQLAARTQEAIESEVKFTRMAEVLPVGVFIGSSDGVINYCNDMWFQITRVPGNNIDKWMDYVKEEHQADVRALWHELTVDKRSVNAEFRFKAPWTDKNGLKGDMWVLFSAYPERSDDGGLKGVFGSMTNISTQKWAEGFQKRKMEEAVELKRQQENFIDITSHEMRNPLSAILQCADEIVLSLGERKKDSENSSDVLVYEDNIDAAHTIALCAQHQKRIVDDILTLSKLDSALLMVTPVDVQPVTVAQRALKMFEGEVQSADIEMRFKVDSSMQQLNVDWCRFDPSRVLQVLINLTTNAIKFTTSESKRIISISLAASKTKFSDLSDPVVSYFPSRSNKDDCVESADWGNGESIYIQFAVQDTGRGLSAEEKKLLFLRFSQASPRTHVQYGGSGLGLFISRELTELQGGEIGVASEAGKGSTFAFFIRARKTVPPTTPMEKALGMTGRQPSNARIASGGGRVAPTASASARSASSDMDAKKREGALKVLIVEDNLVNQKVLQKQLRNMGCETHVANHGGEALDRLKESWFWAERPANALALDVVLMDQEMPIMDGLTCTRKIRELEEEGKFARHVPVIAVTANARVEQIATAKDAGMDDVVSKPFRIQELIPKMEELTDRFRPPD